MPDFKLYASGGNNAPLPVTVTAGTTKTVGVTNSSAGLAIVQIPGGGGTSAIATTTDTWDAIDSGTATWVTSPAGTASVTTVETISAVNVRGIRLTATTAAATFKVG